jgi:acetylornithine deacetylase/succinyl-diaminopimelate desuccinylase-like protein
MKNNTIMSLLTELVSIPSVFPNENKLADVLTNKLELLGFRVQHVQTGTRKNIVTPFGVATQYLGFYGHMDTVPPHPHYTSDPYTVSCR